MGRTLESISGAPRPVPHLPLRILHAVDESAHSLLYRIAARHGCANVGEVLNLAGQVASLQTGARVGDHLDIFAKLTSKDLGNLEHWTIRPTDDGVMLAGQLVGRPGPALGWANYGRICPTCIADDNKSREGADRTRAYRRSWWDLKAIDCCVQHRTLLVANCPNCGKKLMPQLPNLGRCKCGLNLAAVQTEQVPENSLCGDAYLLGRLGIGCARHHAFLDRLTFVEAAQTMRHVGKAALWRPDYRPSDDDALTRIQAKAESLDKLDDWPQNFRPMLDYLSAEGLMSKDRNNRGYRQLSSAIERNETSLAELKDELRQHALDTIAGNKKRRAAATKLETPLWTTTAQVAKRIGCTVPRLRQAALHLHIIDSPDAWASLAKVSEVDVQRLELFFQEICSGTEAAIAIGFVETRESVFYKLVTKEVIRPCVAGSLRSLFFSKSEIDIAAKALKPVFFSGASEAVFATVADAAAILRCTIIELYTLIFNGRLLVRAQMDARTASEAALISIDEARSALAAIAAEGVSVKDAAALIGMNEAILYGAARIGLLRESQVRTYSGRRGSYVRGGGYLRADVIAFANKYTTIDHLESYFAPFLGKEEIKHIIKTYGFKPQKFCDSYAVFKKKCVYARIQAIINDLRMKSADVECLSAEYWDSVAVKHKPMNDECWSIFMPYVVRRGRRPGRGSSNYRSTLDAIFWVVQVETTWTKLPIRFGKHQQVIQQYARWSRNRLWKELLLTMRANNGAQGALPDKEGLIELVELCVQRQIPSRAIAVKPKAI